MVPASSKRSTELFRPYRISDRREFFRIESYQVEANLALLGTDARGQDVTSLVAQDPTLVPNETIARSSRRPMPTTSTQAFI